MVVVQQSAKSLPDLDAPHTLRFGSADKLVTDALVTAFAVIMIHELFDRSVEGPLTHKDHLVEARSGASVCRWTRVVL